jgi:maltooligosyltrehalose synthase
MILSASADLTPALKPLRQRAERCQCGGGQPPAAGILIQFTLPGAPTVYYGDDAGMTGDDDPDDRRTYPWR